MNGTHEPRESFVRTLEARVSGELVRRAAAPRLPRWVPRSPGRLVFATAVLVLVSMVAGGAAVSATYQAQSAEARELLVRAYQQRLDLGRMQLDLAQKLLKSSQERVAVGAAPTAEMEDARLKARQAEFEVQSLQLQLEEVRLTGVEPAVQVSAPLVSGRDFVTQHWRLEMEGQQAALENAQLWLKAWQRRVAAGMADSAEIETAQARVRDLEFSISGYQRKLDIRQKFVGKSIDGGLADLRVMEIDADQGIQTLTARIDVNRKELERIKMRVSTGQSPQLELAAAEVRLQQAELDLSKAQYDLLLIRRQIEQRGR